jgi:hypothetical protein
VADYRAGLTLRDMALADHPVPGGHPLVRSADFRTNIVIRVANDNVSEHNGHRGAAIWVEGRSKGYLKEGLAVLNWKVASPGQRLLVGRLRVVATRIDAQRIGRDFDVHRRLIPETGFLAGYRDASSASPCNVNIGEVGTARKHRRHSQAQSDQQDQKDPRAFFDGHFPSP